MTRCPGAMSARFRRIPEKPCSEVFQWHSTPLVAELVPGTVRRGINTLKSLVPVRYVEQAPLVMQ
jgi:hypothetical protein